MNKTFKMNYLARDFSTIKKELLSYAERYYADQLTDLSETSINNFLVESISYVGDILSYYLDYQTNETFLATAVENKNVLSLAKSLGYKEKVNDTSSGKVSIYVLIPDDGSGQPDYSKSPIIKKGTQLVSDNKSFFITAEDVKIDSNVVTDYVVARTNNAGNPLYYAAKTYLPVVSGQLVTKTYNISSFVKFRKLYMLLDNVSEIVSVTDSSGNAYHEVPNLSQNIVFKSFYNSDGNPKYILKPVTAMRRFVFDHNDGVPYILFGSKQYKPDEDLETNPVVEPTKFVLNKYNNDYVQDSTFEPNVLNNGDNYGIGPENTTITIIYRSSEGQNNNANIGEINKISNLLIEFEDSLMSEAVKNTIIKSIQIINEEAIIGQNNGITINELKDLAGQIFASQGRAVTAKDYETLAYMMPQKYGSVKRVKCYKNNDNSNKNISLYITCVDRFGYLVKANTIIKENIKTWLSNYKIITDTVDILDTKIINFGINFNIMIDPNANKVEVLDKVKNYLQKVYASKPQIGEAFNILNVYREIRKIKDVLDIKEIKIRNITDLGYSQLPFNIEQNLTNDGNMIKIPKNAIWEIKNPINDIVGTAI